MATTKAIRYFIPLQEITKDATDETVQDREVQGTQDHIRGEGAWRKLITARSYDICFGTYQTGS